MSRLQLLALSCAVSVAAASIAAISDPLPPDLTYRPLPTQPLSKIKADDEAQKPKVMQRQRDLLNQRYDLSNRPIHDVNMSGGRKKVQAGVRVKLPDGVTWNALAEMAPEEIRDKNLLPDGFKPLPHVKQATGGQVFPQRQINEIAKQEGRDLKRFDVDFDLPDHLMPEFPPPIFLTTRPELGDVSRGELLTIKNFYEYMNGIITPVQMEGLRLLLTPFPQEEFNQTEDRKVAQQSMGVACLDCHSNFNTNGAFHLTPDVRPQASRFRLDSTSLRGMFNQQIHGSKRSLRSIEDFTEFEQRTAYFNGDHVSATRKGVNLPDRPNQVAMMAQMQNIIDFPPAPKLAPLGKLDPSKATDQELKGEEIFMGKGQCGTCHVPQTSFLDNNMHDLKLERFYNVGGTANDFVALPDGPIKTFTLRGIKDTPPYLHDGRLMTLADTVEYFNLVLGVKLTQDEKDSLVAYMLTL
ncbi:cytochrome c peroxidase [Phyllobacterium ifriqiyense]|uniref:Cytochrome c peroxidase n=1 Tax=Phyllobacterium ifriqiyense TaxID=314238 RepID=A0ABU0S3C0_9HYPH|nr:cytochrome B6 [Phyllobacterium ifriqiyense]MDQ0995218.1 cytochrome c peroxidase [Phyllobacterium ifriqiyense]